MRLTAGIILAPGTKYSIIHIFRNIHPLHRTYKARLCNGIPHLELVCMYIMEYPLKLDVINPVSRYKYKNTNEMVVKFIPGHGLFSGIYCCMFLQLLIVSSSPSFFTSQIMRHMLDIDKRQYVLTQSWHEIHFSRNLQFQQIFGYFMHLCGPRATYAAATMPDA